MTFPDELRDCILGEPTIAKMKKIIDELLCIFPFEPEFFHGQGMAQAAA